MERFLRALGSQAWLVSLLLVAGLFFGALAFAGLKRDVFPDLGVPLYSIIVQNPALGPEELEAAVLVPLEAQMGGLPGMVAMRSQAQNGVATLSISFEPGVDVWRARQLVSERLAVASRDLPPGTEAPLLSSLTGRLNEVMELVLEAEAGKVDLMRLRDLSELELKNRLLAVPGVATVERLGGYLRQVQVQLDPERMAARNVSLNEVRHALAGASLDVSAGPLTQGPMEWLVRGLGRAEQASELNTTVVAMRGTTPVRLGDVAEVRDAPALRRGLAHRLDGEVVSLRIVKQFGADTMQVSQGVRAAVKELQSTLPPGAKLLVAYDQAEVVGQALGGLGRAMLLGAGFVVLVVLAFLGNWRAAALVTFTLPASLALSALVLKQAGVGLNAMTLGGLAIAVGLWVDAAIIMVEQVAHRLRGVEGAEARREGAFKAAAEVARPIAFATAIVVAVFAPLLALEGLEGRMYAPLAMAVVAAMLAALVLALGWVPAAAAWLLRDPTGTQSEGFLTRHLKRAYTPLLDACLRQALWVRLGAMGLTIPALLVALSLGANLMPELDEGALILNTILPAESSLEQVDRMNHRVEDVLRGFPEVVDVVRRTGRSERTEDPMPHTLSDVLVVLRPGDRPREELVGAMRERIERIPGLSVLFTTPLQMRIDEGLGGSPVDLAVKFYGPDLGELAKLVAKAKALMAPVKGLVDLRAEQAGDLPQLRAKVDREAAARVGLTPGEVLDALRLALAGEVVGQIRRGASRHDLVLRLQDASRVHPRDLGRLLLDAHDGTHVPLAQVATLEEGVGPGFIRREAGMRRLAVEAGVEGRDLAGAAAEVEKLLAQGMQRPVGYRMEMGGKVLQQNAAMWGLALALGAAALAALVLLVLALGSFAEALVVVFVLPDALVGAVAALWLAGRAWDLAALVGLMGLMGIAVQNGLVLITQVKARMAAGESFEVALRAASVDRLRPKLMTALTAMLGLMPMLVLSLPGTELERPLALVMVGGLVSSTAFTLLALPSFYAWVHRRWGQPQGSSEDLAPKQEAPST